MTQIVCSSERVFKLRVMPLSALPFGIILTFCMLQNVYTIRTSVRYLQYQAIRVG